MLREKKAEREKKREEGRKGEWGWAFFFPEQPWKLALGPSLLVMD